MQLNEISRRETRRTWAIALTLLLAIFVAGAPVVQAAVQRVRVTGTPNVKIKDTGNGRINSQAVPEMGFFNIDGSSGALDVRTFAGGTGFLGTGDCDATPPPADRSNVVTIAANEKTIITGIIVTGDDANVAVTAPELNDVIGPAPVANIRSTTGSPNGFIGLGNGLTVTPSSLVFTCTAVGGGAGSGDFVILGQ